MSALGAGALAVAVFLPWYRVSSIVHDASFARPAARPLMRLSEMQALPYMKAFLLILAALALLDALLPLVRARGPVPGGAGGSVALLGAVAAACALYRILDPPALSGDAVSLTLLEGPWLALLAGLTMMLGGMWPRRVGSTAAMSDVRAHGVWPGVSG